jgi:hypothetical protein
LCPEEMIFPSDFSRHEVTQKIPIWSIFLNL